MRNSTLVLLLNLFVLQIGLPQKAVVEGYVFEDGGRGYLNQVKVNFYEDSSNDFVGQAISNGEGFFTIELSKNKEYRLEAYKDIFEKKEMKFATSEDDKSFLKVVMRREEGYLFEVTLAPKRESEDIAVDGITGALIEVYNNTKKEEVLVLENHPDPDFKIQFKKGNHYTIMVRKSGYLVKRMEAFVNVDGCILCFEGVGEVKPGVTDNLTEGMAMGTLLANVELEPIFEGKIIELQNIYYEFGKSKLTKQAKEELKKLASILEDNKHLTVELGSHTDVRGSGPNNRELSNKRASAAVDFLTKERNVRTDRIVAVGYGESQIKNKCLPGVTCTEEEHGENRRTEIKILTMDESSMPLQSLSSMKREEEFERMVLEGGLEQVKIGEDGNSVEDLEINNKEEIKQKVEIEVDEDRKTVEAKEDVSKKTLKRAKEKVSNEELKPEKAVETSIEKAQIEEEVTSELIKEESVQVQKVIAKKEVELKNYEVDNKEADENFSGYRIVVHFSNFPISGDHEIYSKFDNVISFTTAEKNVLYMIGEFKNIEDARDYKASRVSGEFPGSYVVGFINGKKIKVE